MGDYPLRGVTVVDLTQIYNGSYCTFLMAMAGARVIKVEPLGGEHLRRRAAVGGAALPFAMLNSNKSCVTLNLKTARGRELLLDLVARGDVLAENFAPGAMERLGLSYDVLRQHNERLIYASSSGYGLSGPNRDYPAMDLTVQAMTGIISVTGYPDRPPVKAGPAICDFTGGIHLYAAVVTALYEREKTGVGRQVEVSMQEAIYPSLASNIGFYHDSGGNAPLRTANRHPGLAETPYNVYPTKDGHIAVMCVGEIHWATLLKIMGREDLAEDPRFKDPKQRVVHIDDVDALVGAFTAHYEKQALFELLVSNRIPCAPVRDIVEVVNDPHMHARGALQWVDHPVHGRVVLPTSPLRFAGSEPMTLQPSQTLGHDNQAVYGDWLGLDAGELESLRREKVI